MADTTGSRLTLLEKFLTVITAMLALGAAYFGYQTATISDSRDQAQAQVVDTNDDLAALQTDFAELQAENARLREQVGLPGSTGDSSGPTTAATVRRSGQLTLATGAYGDLDSPADPQWDDGISDVSYGGSFIRIASGSAYMLDMGSRKADYETCRNTTGYSQQQVGAVVGAYICIKTNEKRYSAVRVAQLDSSRVTLEVITYDPPDD